jgi:hypothetical protein
MTPRANPVVPRRSGSESEVVKILKTKKKFPCKGALAKGRLQKIVLDVQLTIANQAKSIFTPW